MKSKKLLVAIVPARSGSTGIKNKNFLKLNNIYLTSLAIKIGLSIKRINKVIFSSDSLKILKTFKTHPKLIKFKRNPKLALKNTSMKSVLIDAIKNFEKQSSKKIYGIVILDPTAPLRKKLDVEMAIDLFIKKKPDCLISVHSSDYNPYFTMLEKSGRYFKISKPCSFDVGSRQQAPKVFNINGIVWIYSKNSLLKNYKRIPKKTLTIKTDSQTSVDINTIKDVDKINYYLLKKSSKKIFKKLKF